jgi:hypothetical protein
VKVKMIPRGVAKIWLRSGAREWWKGRVGEGCAERQEIGNRLRGMGRNTLNAPQNLTSSGD